MKRLLLALPFLFACAAGSVDNTVQLNSETSDASPILPSVKPDSGIPSRATPEAGSWDQPNSSSTETIYYYGGQVMTNPINIYTIWYGDWLTSNTQLIVNDLLSNIGASDYFKISQLYYQDSDAQAPAQTTNDAGIADADVSETGGYNYTSDAGVHVSSIARLTNSWSIGYTHGTTLIDGDIQNIVAETLSTNNITPDPEGVYFVFVSADVTEGGKYFNGFCNTYCGWHNFMWIDNVPVKYSFIEDPSLCLDGCSIQATYLKNGFTQSPNNNWGADAMVSVVAHEFEEMATDPNPADPVVGETTAWQDQYGDETADMCSWQYGVLYLTDMETVANVHIGNRDFLVQEQFNPALQHCSLFP